MRPIRLTFEAFKSFPGREEIDFEALGGKGVFLVVGDTGTGKTSIFDAMTWVLYGSLPGERRGRGDPRSQHASPDVQTFVEMEFESRGSTFRVRREAEVERPKKKGVGTTIEEGDAFLAKLTGSATVPVASGRQQVTDACKELVGLELSQFEKVVLLPQGEFTRFLIAAEGDREELLRKLFDGDLYRSTMEVLRASAAQQRAELGDEESRVDEVRNQAAGRLTSVIEERSLDLSIESATFAAEYPALERYLRTTLGEETEARDALAAGAEEAAKTFATAKAARDRFDAVDQCFSLKRELESQESEIDELRLSVAASAAGRPIKEAVDEVEELSEQAAALATAAKEAEAALKKGRKRLTSMNDEVKRLTKARVPLKQLSDERQAWGDLVTALTDLKTAQRDSESARRSAEKAIQAHRKSQASRLAAALEKGKPCPVCGSKDHPKPAAPSAEGEIGDAEVDEAQAAAERETSALRVAEGDVARLRGVLRLPEDFDLKQVPAGKKVAETTFANAEKAEAVLSALESDVTGVEAEVKELETSSAAASGDLQSVNGELKKAREHLDKLKKKNRVEDVEQAVRAVLDEETELIGKEKVDEWTAARRDNEVRLRALLDAGPVPDMRPETEALETDSTEKRQAADAARDAVARLDAALKEAKKLMEEAAKLEVGLAERRDAVDLAERVWKTCDGSNALRVSLERWVLAAELDRVVGQANLHLHDISRGHFALQRKKEDGKLGSLQLIALDAWAGGERGTEMLSGGERFLASLALALGLADVISQGGTASGLRFQALFIDEGFDALSEDYLDLVADVLSDLHSGGRMVGAITHVSSMRDRLPVGIEVTRVSSQGPSTLEVMV